MIKQIFCLLVLINIIYLMEGTHFHDIQKHLHKHNHPRIRRKPLVNRFQKRMIPLLRSNAAIMADSTAQELPGQGHCPEKISYGSIRQKASSIAQKAAQEAKAASDAQQVAGQQAAHQVKIQLAEKALQAAKAAEAALAGKLAVVEQLEQEVREAEAVVQEESQSLQQAQANVNAAMQAAQQATTQLKTLTGAVQTAQANVGNSEQAAQGAQQELSEKTQLMEAAKNRVEQLLRQLSAARSDYANTKQAAYKASTAAHEAKLNAARNKRLSNLQSHSKNVPKIGDLLHS